MIADETDGTLRPDNAPERRRLFCAIRTNGRKVRRRAVLVTGEAVSYSDRRDDVIELVQLLVSDLARIKADRLDADAHPMAGARST